MNILSAPIICAIIAVMLSVAGVVAIMVQGRSGRLWRARFDLRLAFDEATLDRLDNGIRALEALVESEKLARVAEGEVLLGRLGEAEDELRAHVEDIVMLKRAGRAPSTGTSPGAVSAIAAPEGPRETVRPEHNVPPPVVTGHQAGAGACEESAAPETRRVGAGHTEVMEARGKEGCHERNGGLRGKVSPPQLRRPADKEGDMTLMFTRPDGPLPPPRPFTPAVGPHGPVSARPPEPVPGQAPRPELLPQSVDVEPAEILDLPSEVLADDDAAPEVAPRPAPVTVKKPILGPPVPYVVPCPAPHVASRPALRPPPLEQPRPALDRTLPMLPLSWRDEAEDDREPDSGGTLPGVMPPDLMRSTGIRRPG